MSTPDAARLLSAWTAELGALIQDLIRLEGELPEVLAREPASDQRAERIESQTDLGIGVFESIAEAVGGARRTMPSPPLDVA